jgi:hypothetical protein
MFARAGFAFVLGFARYGMCIDVRTAAGFAFVGLQSDVE